MTTSPLNAITHRPLRGDADALRFRQLLIDSHARLGCEFNWEPRRWEGAFWSVTEAERLDQDRDVGAHLWETAAGELVGVAVEDGPGDLALQIHPDYRALEDEILAWAEAHLARVTDSGQHELVTWAFSWDTERQARLQTRGYVPRSDWFWHNRRRRVSKPIPIFTLPEGYTIRSLQDSDADTLRWVTCTNAVFGQSYTAEQHRTFQRHAPSHAYDLHLVVAVPDGSFAAFAGLTVEPVNRYAMFEPVGTHPAHRRKGLARAAMLEGIRRLQALGTTDTVYVANWGTSEAGQLYAAVGMELYTTVTAWVKTC